MIESDYERFASCQRMNVEALAFVGDAIYELFVRKHVAEDSNLEADKLHKETVKYVRAESQAKALKKLKKNFLTDEEIQIARYARNHKTPNRSRSAGAMDYKLSTAFEALLGKLEADGNTERTEEIMGAALVAIDGGG